MRRVSVVGISGSGKSTLARAIAAQLDVPCTELDAVFHQPNWEPLDADAFLAEVDRVTHADGWVVDGNYRAVVIEGPTWERADTVVWLDLPKHVVMRQIVGRSVRRVVTGEELWNGNRERWRNLVAWDPARSVVRWAWVGYRRQKARYQAAMLDPSLGHLTFVRLRSHEESAAWLRSGMVPPSDDPAAVGRAIEVERVSDLAASRAEVWSAVSTMAGVNAELLPMVRMTFPSQFSSLAGQELVPGNVVFRSWLLAGGVVPIDRHALALMSVADGEGFLEESSSWLQKRWRHERTLADLPSGGCRVTDRLLVEPRVGFARPMVAVVVGRVFTHRHERLVARFGAAQSTAAT